MGDPHLAPGGGSFKGPNGRRGQPCLPQREPPCTLCNLDIYVNVINWLLGGFNHTPGRLRPVHRSRRRGPSVSGGGCWAAVVGLTVRALFASGPKLPITL